MPTHLKSYHRIYKVLLVNKWQIVFFLIVITLGVELVEHRDELSRSFISFPLLIEIIIFAFGIPTFVGIILHFLSLSESRRASAEANQTLFVQISKQITSIDDWQELCELVVHFPLNIMPFSNVFFFWQRELHSNIFDLVSFNDAVPEFNYAYPNKLKISDATYFQQKRFQPLSKTIFPKIDVPKGRTGYCLPFSTEYACFGMLHLYLPDTYTISENDINVLNSLTFTITSGIIRLAPFTLNNIIQPDKERILLARHLHDTVGQNLGYLLLAIEEYETHNLSFLSSKNQIALEKIKTIANETYEEVRNILTTLRPIGTQDLAATLYEVANLSARRQAKLEIQMIQEGRSQQLDIKISQRLIAISREAITNVVKHAQASLMIISLNWQDNHLTVSIKDNGRGIEPETSSNDHFGMQMMFEQASEIGASFQVNSLPSQGVEVSLKVPLTKK